jgi:hypothetical protein
MPMAQQRRQQMFDDAALAGFDLHRRRHAGRKTAGALYFFSSFVGRNTRTISGSDACRCSNLRLLDERMQRLDCGLPALHGDKQADRMRRQHVFVGDNPVISENLQRPERQFRRNSAEAGETHRA